LPDRITDELLLERAGAGESAAFLQVYERHRDPVFRFAYRLSGSVETAEDITHDCFLGLLRKPENFTPGRASLRTYLLAAARNLWFKRLRTVDRETELDEINEQRFEAVGRGPLREILDDELTARVKEAVSDLPPMQREALVLFEYEGLALHEIAEIVGADVGAVKARLHRARQGLRSSLSTYLNSNREIVTLEKA
jgi:RNA polymerase sigma-70 factor (ECF subfamily)